MGDVERGDDQLVFQSFANDLFCIYNKIPSIIAERSMPYYSKRSARLQDGYGKSLCRRQKVAGILRLHVEYVIGMSKVLS